MRVHEKRRLLPFTENEWKEWGACADAGDPDVFYPPRGKPVKDARMICADCPVQAECLDAALTISPADDWGVWGGTTKQQREALRRERLLGHRHVAAS